MTGSSHKDFISITLVAPYDITRHDSGLLKFDMKMFVNIARLDIGQLFT